MTRHQKRLHFRDKNAYFRCEICRQAFKLAEFLQRHMECEHPNMVTRPRTELSRINAKVVPSGGQNVKVENRPQVPRIISRSNQNNAKIEAIARPNIKIEANANPVSILPTPNESKPIDPLSIVIKDLDDIYESCSKLER